MSSPGTEGGSDCPRPRRRWLRIIIGLSPGLLLIGGWISFEVVADRRLRWAVAEADRTDPGWRQADIWAARASVPDDRNSAIHIQKMIDRLPQGWPAQGTGADTAGAPGLSELSGRLSKLDPVRRLTPEDDRRLHEVLNEMKPVLSLARELVRMPNGRHAIPDRFLFLKEPTDHANKLREVVRVLELEAFERIQHRDTAGALAICIAIFHAGRSIGDEPILIPQLIRSAADAVGLLTVHRALAQGVAGDEVLEQVQDLLARESEEPLLLFALRGERAALYDTFQRLADRGINLADWVGRKDRVSAGEAFFLGHSPGSIIRYNQALALEAHNRTVDMARRPLHEQATLWAQYETTGWVHPNGLAGIPGIISGILSPAYGPAGSAFLRTRTLLSVARVMLAVERFRLLDGHWPDSIEQVVPRFLTDLPNDPLTTRGLILRKHADGVSVYSLGSDETDDHGRFEPRNIDRPGYDLGFRLWDVASRSRSLELPDHVFAPERHEESR